jgi:hypothetical protein
VKQPGRTVQDVIDAASESLGEKLHVVRFVRFDTDEAY